MANVSGEPWVAEAGDEAGQLVLGGEEAIALGLEVPHTASLRSVRGAAARVARGLARAGHVEPRRAPAYERAVRITYLGTASVLIELAGQRLLTDPALDPAGSRYDFGPWYAPRAWFASEKQYASPALPAGPIDAVLLSHDHHADNLDLAGRRLLATGDVRSVLTTRAGAARLGEPAPRDGDTRPGEGLGIGAKVRGLAAGERAQVGPVTITATPGRHGPAGTPQVHEVIGFLIEAPGEPTTWISGDTVLYPELERCLDGLRGKPVEVAVLHAGGVRFPSVPVLGRELFTFDAAQLTAAAVRLDPRAIVPIHRDGWAHFREPVSAVRSALEAAGLGARTRWLELGEAAEYSTRA